MSSSTSSATAAGRPQIAILDFGSQYTHLIARRVREANVFCELYSCLVTLEDLLRAGDGDAGAQKDIRGVILSGGPSSVYAEGAPHVQEEVWEWAEREDIPIMGVCYGMQEIAWKTPGGRVEPATEGHEYGRAHLTVVAGEGEGGDSDAAAEARTGAGLLEGVDDGTQVWMSHGDKIVALPEGYQVLARSENSEHAVIVRADGRRFGMQFHPEVSHTPQGKQIIKNFVLNICNMTPDWVMSDMIDSMVRDVQQTVGETGNVIGAVSGGVDSTVAACLMTRALGTRFHAILVDNGCLRLNEAEEVRERLQDHLGINLHVVDASDRFLAALGGVDEPEKKRKIIGHTFIDVFQEEAERIGDAEYLLQGTLYPDVIESISYKGPSATIKSHHNVGGLPDVMHLKVIEPLRELFKDEVRQLGEALGIPHESVWRHPFPGPGLAIRVLGHISQERLDTLRQADAIMREEITTAGVYYDIAQAFVVLLPVQSVGVQGDFRTYADVAAIRAVTSSDYMTADWYHFDPALISRIANRIVNEVTKISRVCLDVSSKPPATIEWE